jgi:hypothetical protein
MRRVLLIPAAAVALMLGVRITRQIDNELAAAQAGVWPA